MKWSKKINDHFVGIVFMIFSIIAYQQTYGFKGFKSVFFYNRPEYYPRLIAIILFFLGLYTFLVPFFMIEKTKTSNEIENLDEKNEDKKSKKWYNILYILSFLVMTIVYVMLLRFRAVGFIWLTFVYLLVLFCWVGGWKWFRIIQAGVISFSLFYIFYNFFHVPLT